MNGSKPKHRARAVEAMALHLCASRFTDGFCSPRDGKCHNRPHLDCMRAAEGCMRAMETVGIKVVWPYDKEQDG